MKINEDKLVAFFYILLRDELPLGNVNAIMNKHIDRIDISNVTYSDKLLHQLAVRCMEKLQ